MAHASLRPASLSTSLSYCFLALAACGTTGGDAVDAGSEPSFGHHTLDAAPYEAAPIPKTRWDRMQSHGGYVLTAPHLRVIYIGTDGLDASQSFDTYITWMVSSTLYWSAFLAQYGVHNGTLDGSQFADKNAFFHPGDISSDGTVSWATLENRVKAALHPTASADAGADANADADADADANASLPIIPNADAYIFFLPDNVQVDLGSEGKTCVGIGGYHSYDGLEPYAIIPSCGRNHLVISHESAEMCTDPVPGNGWYSDEDISNAGGEIGDLCNQQITIDNNTATQLWSNKDGDCEPSF